MRTLDCVTRKGCSFSHGWWLELPAKTFLTEYFVISEPQNPSIHEFHAIRKLGSADFRPELFGRGAKGLLILLIRKIVCSRNFLRHFLTFLFSEAGNKLQDKLQKENSVIYYHAPPQLAGGHTPTRFFE